MPLNILFGTSRSWANREAKRRARYLAQRKRRLIVRSTASIFSLVVLSVSLWSLMRMRDVTYTSEPRTKDQDSGSPDESVANAAVKMPEPAEKYGKRDVTGIAAQAQISRTFNSTESHQTYQGAMTTSVGRQDAESNETVSLPQKVRNVTGYQSAGHSELENEDARESGQEKREADGPPQLETSERQSEPSKSNSSENEATRDEASSGRTEMSPDEAVGQASEDSLNTQEEDRTFDRQHSEKQWRDEPVDSLDDEEGGHGPIITLPHKAPLSSRNDEDEGEEAAASREKDTGTSEVSNDATQGVRSQKTKGSDDASVEASQLSSRQQANIGNNTNASFRGVSRSL